MQQILLHPAWPFVSALGLLVLIALAMHIAARGVQSGASRMLGVKAFSILTAPGVVVHELAHALFCILFAHKIQQIQFFQLGKDGTLGFVKHAYNPRNPYAILGNFFIGTGPIWIGGIAVLFLVKWIMPWALPVLGHVPSWIELQQVGRDAWAMAQSWQAWLGFYMIFAIGAHVRLSGADLKNSAGAAGILMVLIAGGVWAYVHFQSKVHSLSPAFQELIQATIQVLVQGLRGMAWALVPALVLNVGIALLLNGLAKLLRR